MGWLGFERQVALRFLREGRMQTLLIIVGVAAGVAVIAYISALIAGLQASTLKKTLGAQPHISVQAPDDVVVPAALRAQGTTVLFEVQVRAQRLRTLATRKVAAAPPPVDLWDGALPRLIAQCARNRPLLTAFSLLDRIRSNPDWVHVRAKARSRSSIAVPQSEHDVLIAAIAARNPAAARQAMHDHLSARFAALMIEFTEDAQSVGE